MQVPLDPRLHLSCRVVRLEKPDDAEIAFDGFEHVFEDQLFFDRRLGRRRSAELLDERDDVGLLEELPRNGETVLDRSCSNSVRANGALARDPNLLKRKPDAAECGSARRNRGRRLQAAGRRISRGSKSTVASENRRRHEFECQCPDDAFAAPS